MWELRRQSSPVCLRSAGDCYLCCLLLQHLPEDKSFWTMRGLQAQLAARLDETAATPAPRVVAGHVNPRLVYAAVEANVLEQTAAVS